MTSDTFLPAWHFAANKTHREELDFVLFIFEVSFKIILLNSGEWKLLISGSLVPTVVTVHCLFYFIVGLSVRSEWQILISTAVGEIFLILLFFSVNFHSFFHRKS